MFARFVNFSHAPEGNRNVANQSATDYSTAMPSDPVETRTMTPEEYLVWERASETRHQFFRGEVFDMAGASRAHNLIVMNLSGELRNALRQRSCEAYAMDMRVRIPATGLYTYPDLSVVCGPPLFDDTQNDTLTNPQVIVEVLSDSTESFDRGRKFEQYRTLPSLREYVLASQSAPILEHFSYQQDGSWVLRERRPGQLLELATIACAISVDEIYARVFDSPTG